MYFLALSIVCSTLNHLIFKAFQRWNIAILSAIVTNYLICIFIGYVSLDKAIFNVSLWHQKWFFYSWVQGCLFIGSFFFMGLATQRSGIGVAALSSRLAVVIPILAAFILYGDSLNFFKLTGILGAIIALYLGSTESESLKKLKKDATPILPLALFILFGFHLTFAKYVQEFHLNRISYHGYVMFAFASAFLIGLSTLAYCLVRGTIAIGRREIGAGIILGINNYGSIYFLIRALGQDGWESSVIFPTISVAVVILSFLGGSVLFGEGVSRRKRIAMTVGVVAILCINR